MPWISKKRHNALLKQLTDAGEREKMLLGQIGQFHMQISGLPDRAARAIVAQLRELPAKVLVQSLDQPLSIGAADKERVREQREKESRTK